MSIEITGPNAFDYQYLATAYLTLSLYAADTTISEIYIEKVGGEDAEIVYTDEHGATQTIEIQAKSDAGRFDMTFLAAILCHFGNHQAGHNLTSRLIAQPGKKAFIIIQGRCDDDTYHFIVNNGQFDRTPVDIPEEVKRKLILAVKDCEKAGTTTLKKKRNLFCQKLAVDLEQDIVFNGLTSKIFIYEKLLQDELRDKCEHILFKSLNIPLLQAGIVLNDLLKSITDGRNKRHNISAAFEKLIDANQASRPDMKPDYLKRPEEQTLIDQLRTGHKLLLKGRSLCGKSSTAKAIARHFTDRGYFYRITSNYEDAERFLLSADTVDKICLLDDPMGFIYQEIKSEETYQKINHMVSSLPPGRKIIITANNDVLTRLGADNDSRWSDLTVRDPKIAGEIWLQFQRTYKLPNDVFGRVENFISNAVTDKVLQPGQLYYIANNWSDLPASPSADLWQFAAVDADLVISALKQKGEVIVRVFRAMGLVSNTITPIHELHLNYVFSTVDTFPAIRHSRFGLPGSSMLEIEAEETDHFPIYPMLEKLPTGLQQALDFLTRCGFLYYYRGSYNFAHPVYYQAAQQLLIGLQKGEADDLDADLKKALSLLAFENALIASKQLAFIFNNNSTDVKEKLIGLASIMERSIYPAVIDNSLIFLSSITSFLDDKQIEQAQSRLTSFEMDARSFRWHNGIPFIPDVDSLERRLDLEYGLIESAEFNAYHSQMLDNSQPNLTAEQAWNFSKYLKYKSIDNPISVEPLVLNKLLDFNEAFIRSIAAFHILHQFSNPPDDLIVKALNDAHPFVVLNGIKGFVRGWYKYDAAIKEQLFNTVLACFSRVEIVTAATNFITQFGIGYSNNSFDWRDVIPKENQPDMWLLWASFAVKFFEKIPGNIHFNTHRFIETIRDSEEILPKADQAIIARAWLIWMRSSEKYSGYSDSLFYITNYYFSFRNSLQATECTSFTKLLLDTGFTYFASNNLRFFLYHWDNLLAEEKELVYELLSDVNGLLYQAVTLTAAKRPLELNQFILGTENWEEKPIAEIIALIPRPLMEKCISARFVTHRFTGLNYASWQLWFQILGHYLNDHSDILCKVAVKTLMDNYHYGSEKDYTAEWGDTEQILLKMFADNDFLHYIYYLLLEEISVSAHSNSSSLWVLLKEHTDAEFHELMKKGVIENINDIESSSNLAIIDELWGDEFYQKAFPTDAIILLMFKGYYQFEEAMPDLTEAIAQSFEKILLQSTPQLRLTFDRLITFVEKRDPTNFILLEMAKSGRENYYKEDSYPRREKLREFVEGPFEALYIN